MTAHHALLIIHLLAATIWVGGHLLLAVSYVPRALRENNREMILDFESRYEKLGMSALVVLVATGIAMAISYGVYPDQWFRFDSAIENVVSTKLTLLIATLMFALSARFRVIPRLKSGQNGLIPLVVHILSVTTIGVMMVVIGSFIRFGGI